MSRKEYMRDYMAKKRANKEQVLTKQDGSVNNSPPDVNNHVVNRSDVNTEPGYTWLPISPKLFDGVGRGIPINIENREGKYVLISRGGETEDSVISKQDWQARLAYTCRHGREGWSCKLCMH